MNPGDSEDRLRALRRPEAGTEPERECEVAGRNEIGSGTSELESAVLRERERKTREGRRPEK